MKVRELIAELQKFDQDSTVVFDDFEYGCTEFDNIKRRECTTHVKRDSNKQLVGREEILLVD